jgi:thioredoxin-dependent peroxiredoxin
MNLILSSLLILIFNMSTVQKGSSIPNLILADQNGKVFNLKNETNGKATVVYFYPKDDTPGCTAEACSFRDNYQDFLDMGALVIGISGDSPASHKKFAEKYNLPYTLLSDPNKEARKAFNVPTDLLGLIPGRVTYIFDKKGVCQGVFKSQTKATQHIDEALKILKSFE